MLETKREALILNYLLDNEKISKKALSNLLNLSEKTLKKDLIALKKNIVLYDSTIVENQKKEIQFFTKHSKAWWLQKIEQVTKYELIDLVIIHLLFLNRSTTTMEIADCFYYNKTSIDRVIYSHEFQKMPFVSKRNVGIVFSKSNDERLDFLIDFLVKKNSYSDMSTSLIAIFNQVPSIFIKEDDVLGIFKLLKQYLEVSKNIYTDKSIKKIFVSLVVLSYYNFESNYKINDEAELIINYFEKFLIKSNYNQISRIINILRKKNANISISEINKEILDEIISEVKFKLKINLDGIGKIYVNLLDHLNETIARETFLNTKEYDVLIKNFRIKYATAYEAGMIAINILKKYRNLEFQEIEIVYFGMYFQMVLEEKINFEFKIEVALICEHGFGISNFIKNKLTTIFDEINISMISSVFELMNNPESFKKFDLLICTVKDVYTSFENMNKMIFLSPVLEQNDLNFIKNKISAIYFKKFTFDKFSLIETNLNINSKEKLLEYICFYLKKNKIINDKFHQSILERENLTPTAFGKLAIPHGSSKFVLKTAFVIVSLKEGIIWNSTNVKLVCIFLATTDDLINNKENITYFYQQLADEKNISSLIKVKNKKDILKILYKENYE